MTDPKFSKIALGKIHMCAWANTLCGRLEIYNLENDAHMTAGSILEGVDLIVPANIAADPELFRIFVKAVKANFDDVVESVFPSTAYGAGTKRKAAGSLEATPTRARTASSDASPPGRAPVNSRLQASTAVHLDLSGDTEAVALLTVHQLAGEQQAALLRETFANHTSLAAKLYTPILAELHDSIRALERRLEALCQCTFAHTSEPGVLPSLMTSAIPEFLELEPVEDWSIEQVDTLCGIIQTTRSAFDLVRIRMHWASRIFQTAELHPDGDWRTVQQLLFRQQFDLQAKRLNEDIVLCTDYDTMVKDAMETLNQAKKASVSGAKVCPVCPDLARFATRPSGAARDKGKDANKDSNRGKYPAKDRDYDKADGRTKPHQGRGRGQSRGGAYNKSGSRRTGRGGGARPASERPAAQDAGAAAPPVAPP